MTVYNASRLVPKFPVSQRNAALQIARSKLSRHSWLVESSPLAVCCEASDTCGVRDKPEVPSVRSKCLPDPKVLWGFPSLKRTQKFQQSGPVCPSFTFRTKSARSLIAGEHPASTHECNGGVAAGFLLKEEPEHAQGGN